ncbi:MAG: hypothetical protein AABZ08_01125 [Planctomycetota bacterium]
MYHRPLVTLLSLLVVTVAMPRAAEATPSEYKVQYSIHETRNDPESAVIYRVSLELEYATTVNKQNSWNVTTILVSHVDSQGTVDEQWRLTNPSVSTGDGKWWTAHDDTDNPVIGEFVSPPPMTGTADREIGSGADMNYDLSTGTASGSPPYAATAYLNLRLQRVNEPEPDLDDDEMPMETTDIPPA